MISAAGEGTESDDPAGVLMRRLIDSFAEYERLMISARTRAALAAKRRRGERVSGYRAVRLPSRQNGRTLEADAEESATLEAIRRLRAEGRSLRAVADALNTAGMLTRARTPWRFEYVGASCAASQWDMTGRSYPSHDASSGIRARNVIDGIPGATERLYPTAGEQRRTILAVIRRSWLSVARCLHRARHPPSPRSGRTTR